MNFQEIIQKIKGSFEEEVILKTDEEILQAILFANPKYIVRLMTFLQETEDLYFDMLSCITAIDLGPEKDKMELVYNLYSIPYNHHLTIKVELDRKTGQDDLPSISTVSNIWKTADWHEREAYDLMGIRFEGHQDLRRILLPQDWEGHPLRKDYQEQEKYHGITVKYTED